MDPCDDETVAPLHGRVPAVIPPQAPFLATGSVFGQYRIVRLLGRGGMSVVYEADEIESGRRVALKVLHGRPDASERELFEREGRLTSSVNHPNCVFVFGAGEIDGHLVIAMEVMQGTLADRLKAGGPLTPAAAVDAVLQIVEGLQAAAAAGILHRDVKPSNCFVDAEGVVKIGDFGISRSQRPTDETVLSTSGQHRATPAYASPEQLRGAALDVRADIYSVGATLYELLTGRRPFERADLMALLMAVANDAPIPPHIAAPAVTNGLSAVVLHCLAKRPEQRFSDYEALAAALEPYSSGAPTTGTLGRRCLAGVIDAIPILVGSIPIGVLWGVSWLTIPPFLTVCLMEVLYFAICESRWAASPGKAMCGLVIVQQGGTPARAWQASVRALVYVMLPAAFVIALMSISPATARSLQAVMVIGVFAGLAEPVARVMASPQSLTVAVWPLNGLMLLLLFSTARRRNGYAGLHDLLSRTRVVERRVRAIQRPASDTPAAASHNIVARLGPFAVLSGTVTGMPDGWRPGFDERLRRPVWIREVAPATPSISAARRAINRATRLRWLAGRRNGNEAWDAFEAVQGVPLDRAATRPRTWRDARYWLRDLARECAAQSGEDQPPRRRDRVWVLDTAGAKLIDDPAVDQLEVTSGARTPIASFLLDVMRAARGSAETQAPAARTIGVPPWPLSVHRFLEQLTVAPDMNASFIKEILEALMRRRSAVTQGWRTLTIVIPLLIPVMWAATTVMQTLLPTASTGRLPWYAAFAMGLTTLVTTLIGVATVALVDAVVFRGGVMRILGLELVTTDGRLASRWRVLARTALAWAPMLLLALITLWGSSIGSARVSGLLLSLTPPCLLLMLAGAIVAIVNPARGIQDRLAGTWIVPR